MLIYWYNILLAVYSTTILRDYTKQTKYLVRAYRYTNN